MSYSILIVDDSLPMRAVIKKTLTAAGYGGSEIIEASNGEEALELMRHNWIDLVMTDYNMPVMNGLDFIKNAQKEQLLKDVPVVVVSTEGNEARIKEFTDCGAAGYVTKPFTAETLKPLIENVLGEADYEDLNYDSNDEFDF